MIDINLLRLMRVRSDYNRILGAVNTDALDSRTKRVMQAVGKYYEKHPSHGQVDFTVFLPFAERNVFHNLDEEDILVYRNIIKNMSAKYPDNDTRNTILNDIGESNLVHTMRVITEAYNDGEDIDTVHEMSQAFDAYKLQNGATALPEVAENIDDLLDDMDNNEGISWRLDCLNECMRPMRGGDFGILAARPDQGKTSFLCSELTHMAPQLPEGRPILWLNNEGPGYAIRPRLMQAALDCTTSELVEMKEEGTLYTNYYDAVGGENRIRIMDVHGYNTSKVEALIEDTTPGLIIYDMIDNVHGFGGEQRTDLALEKMYQWARERAVKYDATALATSQISAEGIDLQYPGLGMLKDSKTGKQGACEFQLMIGSLETKPEFANTRWLSLPKNKLRRVQSPRLLQQVTFDRDKARYRDIEIDETMVNKDD